MSETSDGVSVPAQAVDDVANAFDQMLPQTPTYIAIKPTRLTYKTPANTTQIIALARENKFHETIFQGCRHISNRVVSWPHREIATGLFGCDTTIHRLAERNGL